MAGTPVHEEMAAAYDAAWYRAGRCTLILVGEGEPPHPEIAVVSLHAYEQTVALALRDGLGREPSDIEMASAIRSPGNEYRGVPVYVRGNR